MDPFIGEIRPFGFNFAPVGWAQCNGQLLSISQNTALFSILGTNFGGNGTSNFGLPNLQAAAPIGQGTGTGLSQISLGETGGETGVTLNVSQMPGHTHSLSALPVHGVNNTPAANSQLSEGEGGTHTRPIQVKTYTTTNPGTTLSPAVVGLSAGGQPHSNMQPSLTVNWCIALVGIFPQRN